MFDSFVLNIKCYSSNKKQIKNKKALNNGDISKKSCAKKSLAKFLYTQRGKKLTGSLTFSGGHRS